MGRNFIENLLYKDSMSFKVESAPCFIKIACVLKLNQPQDRTFGQTGYTVRISGIEATKSVLRGGEEGI